MGIPNRLKRVNNLLKQHLSEIIRKELRDPRIEAISPIVVDVETAADLRHARVFISIMDTPDKQTAAMQAFNNASVLIRKMLMDRVDLRNIPALHFKLDTSIERGVRISRLISEISEADKELREKLDES